MWTYPHEPRNIYCMVLHHWDIDPGNGCGMNKAQYLERIAAASSLDDMVLLTALADKDPDLTDAEAKELVDPMSDRLLEVIPGVAIKVII